MAGYAARRYALWLGVALPRRSPLWGFVLGSGESILGFLPVNTGDNFLHLVLGLLGVARRWRTPQERRRPSQAGRRG